MQKVGTECRVIQPSICGSPAKTIASLWLLSIIGWSNRIMLGPNGSRDESDSPVTLLLSHSSERKVLVVGVTIAIHVWSKPCITEFQPTSSFPEKLTLSLQMVSNPTPSSLWPFSQDWKGGSKSVDCQGLEWEAGGSYWSLVALFQ